MTETEVDAKRAELQALVRERNAHKRVYSGEPAPLQPQPRLAVSEPFDRPCTTPGCKGIVQLRRLLGVELPHRQCPVCGPAAQAAARADELRRERARAEAMLEESRMPVRFRRSSLEDVPMLDTWPGREALELGSYLATTAQEAETVRRMREWRPAPRGCLLLEGQKGRGKSLLAAGLLGDRIRSGKNGRWLSWEWLAGALEQPFDSAAYDDAMQLLEACQTCGLLVLDDVGLTTHKRALERVSRLISVRYDSQRPICLTTNLNADQLSSALGEAIFSRLVEMVGGGGAWIYHEGPGFNVRLEGMPNARCR